jgi:hypothetical protein
LKLRYLRDLGFFCGIFLYWRQVSRDVASDRRTVTSHHGL